MIISQTSLVTQLIAWHKLDWRDTAIKVFWPILAAEERQAYIYYTENWLIHTSLLDDLRWTDCGSINDEKRPARY